jgi:WD40 repeat protein
MNQEIDVKSPIFSLYIIKDKLIVACGGGGKKFGIINKILVYQLHTGYIGETLIEKELDEIPEYIEGIPSKNIFCYISKNKIVFNSLANDYKSFQAIYTLTINPEDNILKCFKIEENLLAIGDDNGAIKLFTINFNNNNEIASINETASNENAHFRGINSIEFSFRNKNKFLITASGDGNCKIFDITNPSEKIIKMNSFFSFRQSIAESANYFMRDLIYIKDKHIAYTIQSPRKGKSFLTKWDLSNVNFAQPIETIEVSNAPCSSFDISQNKKYLGITDIEGKIFFVDAKNMKITGWKKIGEEMLRNCKFFNNYLITGSIGHWLKINKLLTSFSSAFFKFIFYVGLFLGICYYIYLKKNKLIYNFN